MYQMPANRANQIRCVSLMMRENSHKLTVMWNIPGLAQSTDICSSFTYALFPACHSVMNVLNPAVLNWALNFHFN